MNLEEAIKYARKEAEEMATKSVELFPSCEGRKYLDCAEEHYQLADWLEELKELRKYKEKYRWHDLRKNPKDLPDVEHPERAWFEVVQKDNEEQLIRARMQYDDDYGFGFYIESVDGCTDFTAVAEEVLAEVVAWREIEEFESEEKE